MNSNTEKREFERHLNDFTIKICSNNHKKERFEEKAVLKNISGSGACFATKKSENYYLGQSVEINIFMPESDDVKALMSGTGTVVRIEKPSSNSNSSEKRQLTDIAITLDNPILLQRIK